MPGKTKKSQYTLGRSANAGLHDVTLPSGATCQARRPGVQGLIDAGLLDNFDELTALVQTEIIDPNTNKGQIAAAQKVSPEEVKSAAEALVADKDKLATAFHLVDRLVAYVVTQPVVWIDYQLKDESDEDFAARSAKAEENEAIAVREVDLEDKMFLMDWSIGGTSDLKSFRKNTDELMADVAAS